MKSQVAIVKCNNYNPDLVFAAVTKAVDSLGGISAFIKLGSRVLVKPNLLMAKEPEYGVDTHPQVVRAVVKILKAIDCRIFIGDGPSVWGKEAEDIDTVYDKSGIRQVAEEERVELVKFEKKRWRGKFPLTSWLDETDYLISIPKFKTHSFTLLTGAIKNLFGLIPGTFKTELHKKYFTTADFSKMLVDIYQEARPQLTIVDGIVAMEGDGPGTGGKLRNLGLLLAGPDCVALDSCMAMIMGIKPQDILTTREAALRGLGAAEIDPRDILGEKLEAVRGKPFLLPTSTPITQKIPLPILKLAKKLIRYYPCVEMDNCVKCAACIQACPQKAIRMEKRCPAFEYSKCIACFCCQEACPQSAIKVKKSLLAKIIGL